MIINIARIVQDTVDGFAQYFNVIRFCYHTLEPIFFES